MVVGMRARGISGQRYLVADAEAERDKGKVNGVRTAETERINPCINEGSYQQKEKKKKFSIACRLGLRKCGKTSHCRSLTHHRT